MVPFMQMGCRGQCGRGGRQVGRREGGARKDNKETQEMYSMHPDVLLILQLLSCGCGIYALTHRQNPRLILTMATERGD